jgi:Fur family zinc uptake transcriptional regulator
MTSEQILKQLKEMGYKMTPQRRMLVEALLEAQKDGLTADDLYQKVRTAYPDMGLDTVYRNLRLLTRLNVVTEVKRPGKLAQYSLNRHVHSHSLTCLCCGIQTPLNHCPVKELEAIALEEHGFMITSHRIELQGYCPDCWASRQAKNNL